MASVAVLVLALAGARAVLAAEGGLRGAAALDGPLNGSTSVGVGGDVGNASAAGLAGNSTSSTADAEDAAAAAAGWSEADEEALDGMSAAEMLFENGSFPEMNSSSESAALESMAQWGGKVLTLYHQTSRDAAHSIFRHGFRRGSRGWCGGGIYFATSPEDTFHKAIGPDSQKGYIIAARVNVGRMKWMSPTCDRSMTGSKLRSWGYDSIRFNPGDGDEYVVYDSWRVVSMWHHRR